MRPQRWLKRAGVAVMASTLLLVVTFHVIYKPASMFSRHERERDRHLGQDHTDPLPAALKNCSCDTNDVRHHGEGVERGASEAGSGLVKNKTVDSYVPEITTNTTVNHTRTYILESDPAPKGDNILVPKMEKRPPEYLSEPIDRHTFNYIHNPEKVCFLANGTQSSIYLLFYVPTAPENFVRRSAIRKSYGDDSTWPSVDGAHTKTVFMIGRTGKTDVQRAIDDEAHEFGDIVQEDFIDSYLNLTLKTIMALKWVTHHCRHARYVMKIDDDTTVNQPRILQIVKAVPKPSFCIGYVFKNPIVDRNPKSKFFLSPEYFPDKIFPAYINGMGYIMSVDVVEALFQVAITIPLFPWEDVFIGMCLDKLKVRPHHDDNFLSWALARNILGPKGPQMVAKNAIVTNLKPDDIRRIYDRLRIK